MIVFLLLVIALLCLWPEEVGDILRFCFLGIMAPIWLPFLLIFKGGEWLLDKYC